GRQRESRECEVSDEHLTTSHDARQWNRCERADESADVEQVGSAGFPSLRQEACSGWLQMNTRRVLVGESSAQERNERVAGPPAQQSRDRRNEAAQRRSAHPGSEQLAWARCGLLLPAIALVQKSTHEEGEQDRCESREKYVTPGRLRPICEPHAG